MKAALVVIALVATAALALAAANTYAQTSRSQEAWIMWHRGTEGWTIEPGVDGFENRATCVEQVKHVGGAFCFPASFNPKKAEQ